MAVNLSARRHVPLVLVLPALQLAGAFLHVTYGCGRVCPGSTRPISPCRAAA